MEKEAGRVFQDDGGLEAIHTCKFAGLDAFLNQALKDAQNLFTTTRCGIRPDLDNVAIGFEDFGVLLQFLFSFAMQFKNDGFNARRGGDGPVRNFFDELFDFCEPFVDDCIENIRFGFEETIDIGVRHVQRARNVYHGQFVIAIAAQKCLSGLKYLATSFA